MKPKAKSRDVVTWLVVAFVSVLLLSQRGWVGYYKLTQRGMRTVGKVTKVFPKRRHEYAKVGYTYKVEGREYDGRDYPSLPNPPIQGDYYGTQLIVFYDPKSPKLSALGDPKLRFKHETKVITFGALIIPTFVIVWQWGIARRRRLENWES